MLEGVTVYSVPPDIIKLPYEFCAGFNSARRHLPALFLAVWIFDGDTTAFCAIWVLVHPLLTGEKGTDATKLSDVTCVCV